jgi:predicted ATP-grasp superfamily ATP-dependent carboligase
LLGLPFVFQQEPFGYCGNIVPLHIAHSTLKKCKAIAEKIALHFGLKGSNGIDIIISNDGTPYVIEVNPRFQGSSECIEKESSE